MASTSERREFEKYLKFLVNKVRDLDIILYRLESYLLS